MDIVGTLVLFFLGFFILVRGAQILVKGAASAAKLFGVSSWFIGIAIVGIGTSIPEFSINLVAAFEGNAVGIGTIIGSNTFNILMILGVSALFMPIVMRASWLTDFFVNMATVLVAGAMLAFPLAGDPSFVGISRMEAGILFALFITWLIYMFRRGGSEADEGEYQVFTAVTSIIMVIAGGIGVFIGGQWVVDGAEAIAAGLGVSPSVVALTIVGAGTSLPELTVSVVAAMRRNMGIAVGNVLGSNIFDFLGILGITGLIHPIAVAASVRFDITATFLATLLLLAVLFIGRRYTLGRFEGLIFIAAYIVYLAVFFWRG
jgi:cation:H+ antiporter